MLTFRIAAAGAILFAMASAASAQSDPSQAPSETPGKPVSLLQMLLTPRAAAAAAPTTTEAPATTETTATTKVAHRHWRHRRYANKKSHPAQSDDAAATPPAAQGDTAQANAAPPADASTAATAAMTLDAPATASMPGMSATASVSPEPSAMVVDGHTVQISSQDEFNALDLAANGTTTDAPPQAAVGQPNLVADTPAATDNAPATDTTAAANTIAVAADDNTPAADSNPVIDSKPADTPVIALAERDDTSKSRDVWYEDLLAILGGVLAAASAAWFLLGSAPPRRDGREPMLMYETERMRR
jgi:hypothetical protein